jgi:AraC family transcriptional regulator of arabinose operon
MAEYQETPSIDVHRIATGHYHERGAYYAHRASGTPDWLLVYTVSGSGRFGYPRGEIVSRPGELTLLKPRTLHDYGLVGPARRWELFWAHFHPRPEWAPLLRLPEAAPGLGHLKLHDEELRMRIEARLFDMHRLARSSLRQSESLAMNALEEVLLWCDLINPRSMTALIDPRIRRAVDYISQDPRRSIALGRQAARSALSRSRFSYLFRSQIGKTPQQLQEEQRIGLARQLLTLTSRSVAQIAQDLGFSSPYYFSLRFKRATGKSPRAYRRKTTALSFGPHVACKVP